jgi:hypothetical protein
MSHTPGPWEFTPMLSGSENHKGFNLWGRNGGLRGIWLGELSPVGTEDGDASEEGIANARLIAAAPDLLAACEMAKGWMEESGELTSKDHYYDFICAAIKKARGQ